MQISCKLILQKRAKFRRRRVNYSLDRCWGHIMSNFSLSSFPMSIHSFGHVICVMCVCLCERSCVSCDAIQRVRRSRRRAEERLKLSPKVMIILSKTFPLLHFLYGIKSLDVSQILLLLPNKSLTMSTYACKYYQ